MTELLPAQEFAISKEGVQYGRFVDDFENINLMDAPSWKSFPRFWRKFRLKIWQHFCAITEKYWISTSIVNARHAATCWCYVFDRHTHQLYEHKWVVPCVMVHVTDHHFYGRNQVHLPGCHICIQNELYKRRHHLKIEIAGSHFHKDEKPSMGGDWYAYESPDCVQPLVLLKDMTEGRLFYTHKVPCPLEGWFALNGERIEFHPERDVGLFDIHAAFYPSRTLWNWATFAFLDEHGQMLGVNLTEGTAFPRQQALNENVIWVGNRIIPLSDAMIFIPSDLMKPWLIQTKDGMVSLQFQPLGARHESIHFGPIVSEYHQPFGQFYGYVKDDLGKRHIIDGAFGCTEKHIATW